MNENTLLSLITGGKYQTSADLPTFRETAHSFMDDLMQKQDAEMSEVLYPAGKNIFGQPTEPVTQEDLLSLVMGTLGPGQGAKSIVQGSDRWVNLMRDLRLSNVLSPSQYKSLSKYLSRGTSSSAKYKDAPHRELEDILKETDMSRPIPPELFPNRVRKLQSSKLTGKSEEAEKVLNEKLLEGFEEMDRMSKKGLIGYMGQKKEDEIGQWARTLLEYLK